MRFWVEMAERKNKDLHVANRTNKGHSKGKSAVSICDGSDDEKRLPNLEEVPVAQLHLSYGEVVNLGSFYTPPKFVRIVAEMVLRNVPSTEGLTVLDSSCGYGAFFSEEMRCAIKARRFIGGDVDSRALEIAERENPEVEFLEANALSEISRAKYGIEDDEPLLIVGNPPYNDVTSILKSGLKNSLSTRIDPDVKTRDLGISFLLSFAKLRPDFVVVLHPLSYLIKHANFKLLAPFFARYKLADSLVINSREFSETSGSGFPIVIAFYEKSASGQSYEDIVEYKFRTREGGVFSISEFDYVKNYLSKYPNRFRAPRKEDFKFWTMRDINALKRSRTFISETSVQAVLVPENKLEYYCYVDIFKDFAGALPYYFGNFDVMFDLQKFLEIKDDFLLLSIAKHPKIFSEKFRQPSAVEISAARSRVERYFINLFGRHANVHKKN